jgi:hypothetical protein
MKLIPRIGIWTALPLVILWLGSPARATNFSRYMQGESTNTYSTCGIYPDLSNRIANTTNFLNTMGEYNDEFELSNNWGNNDVYDCDFVDSDIDSQGDDLVSFDITHPASEYDPGVAISFFSGHGVCDDIGGESCTDSSQCTNPNFSEGQSMPGVCTEGPNKSAGTCIYYKGRQVVTCSTHDAFGHFLDYSDGFTALGESADSGSWRGAGTNGGVNVVVIDNSCGIRPGLEVDELWNAFGGAHGIALIEPTVAGADNIDVSERGAKYADLYNANPYSPAIGDWVVTMNSMGSSEGASCNGTSSGYRGIDGCGAYIVLSVAESSSQADWHLETESWYQAMQDSDNDATEDAYMSWMYVCNYDCVTYPVTI